MMKMFDRFIYGFVIGMLFISILVFFRIEVRAFFGMPDECIVRGFTK